MEISKRQGKTKIKIVEVKGTCLAKHKKGETFVIDQKNLNFCPWAFDAIFGQVNVLLSKKGKKDERILVSCPRDGCEAVFELKTSSGKTKLSPCDSTDFKKLKVEVVKRNRACLRYHKFLGENYSLEEVKPKDLCLEAYHAIYPYALALLYEAKFNGRERINLKCPGVKGSVKMKVLRRRKKSALGWNFLEKASRLVGHPIDFIDSEVLIEVLAREGRCPAGLKAGQVFYFNTGGAREICPASFDLLYPSLILLGRDREVPWSKEEKKALACCPDQTTNITYRISKNGEEENSRVYGEPVGDNLLESFDQLLKRVGFGRLVKPGEKVLIKPNICAPLLPSSGGITKPLLVVHLAEKIKKLGATPIVAEGSLGYGITEKAFRVSGLAALCKKKKIKLYNLDEDGFIVKKVNGKKLKLCACVERVDKIINFPVLKTHLYTQVSLCLKNLLGLAWRSQKSLIHVGGLNQGLADLNLVIKPVLNIMDATISMEGDGPTRGTPKRMGLLLASSDRVALDATGCQLMGIKSLPEHIKLAEKLGIGTTKKTFVSGTPLEKLVLPFKLPGQKNLVLDRLKNLILSQPQLHKFLFKASPHQIASVAGYPVVSKKLCSQCYHCLAICPFKALKKDKDGFPQCKTSSCVKCYACVEICPTGALRES